MISYPRIRILFLSIVCLGFSVFCTGQKSTGNSKDLGVRKFATHFYEWYIKAADTDRVALMRTQELRRALSPELLQAIKQDFEAQAQDKTGYIVGLDFDPFLASQDHCERYEVRKIIKKRNAYLAEIHGVGGCEEHSKPDLRAEATSRNGIWMFTNFFYPGPFSQDLLTLLEKLHHDRMKR